MFNYWFYVLVLHFRPVYNLKKSKMSIKICVPREKAKLPTYVSSSEKHFVSPGEVITEDGGFMKGHGTFADNADRYCCL